MNWIKGKNAHRVYPVFGGMLGILFWLLHGFLAGNILNPAPGDLLLYFLVLFIFIAVGYLLKDNISRRLLLEAELGEANLELSHSLSHDKLTGLPNRNAFLSEMDKSLQRSRRRENYKFAVFFLDLDRFKRVNDSLGHGTGDRILVESARRLREATREGDMIARFGGDEFLVLLDDIKHENDVALIALKIQSVFKMPFIVEGREIELSTSIGIALSHSEYESISEIIRDAEAAMHRAKINQRGGYAIFDQGIHKQSLQRLEIESSLKDHIEDERFRLVYQPIIRPRDRKILGFEALLRWPEGEPYSFSPPEFIPVAEEIGLIIPLGEWVLKTACTQLRLWQELYDPDLRMSVNVSGAQLGDDHFIGALSGTLRRTGIRPEALELEITESALMQDEGQALERLLKIRELGVRLSLDDFGTSYSSLNYLKNFPVDSLKIDKSFVDNITHNKFDLVISRTIILIAKRLDLAVTAEGVETEEQFNLLARYAFLKIQGYYFSRPLSGEAIEDRFFRKRDPVLPPGPTLPLNQESGHSGGVNKASPVR